MARALQVEELTTAHAFQVEEPTTARAFQVEEPITTHVLQAGTIQSLLGMTLRTTHIHPTRLLRVKGQAESQLLWCNVQNVRVETWMAKSAALQLVQPIGARFAAGGLTNQDVGAPPPLGFPHTMLNVERVKDNMWLAFIEKLFTNREIRTNVQTRYLRFKGYRTRAKATCATSLVFNCGKFWPGFGVATCSLKQCQVCGRACHTQKGFVEVATWGRQRMKNTCSLSVQILIKLGNAFVQPSFIHTRTFAEFMQIMNMVTLAKFVACYQYQRTIYPP